MSNSTHDNDGKDDASLERILRAAGKRAQPPEDVSREVKAAVKAVWQEELRNAETRSRPGAISAGTGRWLCMAASVLLMFMVGIYHVQRSTTEEILVVDRAVNGVEYETPNGWQPLQEKMATGPVQVRTAADAFASMTLASGINVRLARNSRVDVREIDNIFLSQGAVYVDSSGRPDEASLRVFTAYGVAKDIGTQFEVRIRPRGWQVQVREGAVKMMNESIDVQVEPGNRVLVSASNQVTRESVPPDDSSWAWIDHASPPIDIEGLPLSRYLAWFERETNRQITFDNEGTRQVAESTILHGSIDGLPAAESLEIVLSSTRLSYILRNDTIVIVDEQ